MNMRNSVKSMMIASLALGSTAAWSGALLQDSLSTCTTALCGAQKIRGFYEKSQPFVIQVYASAGECLRVEVTRQTADLEMAVLSPDLEENHWVDDDSGGSLRPRIEVDPTPVTGWYVVAVADLLGRASKENFDLRYGRYPTGNPNCNSTTAPSLHTATQGFADEDKDYSGIEFQD